MILNSLHILYVETGAPVNQLPNTSSSPESNVNLFLSYKGTKRVTFDLLAASLPDIFVESSTSKYSE